MVAPTVGSVIDGGTLRLESLIGQGGFASVYLARSTRSCDDLYALKVLRKPSRASHHDGTQLTASDDDEQDLHPQHLKEARLHARCSSSPNLRSSITPLLKTIVHRTESSVHTCLLLPYYPSGDLFSAIMIRKAFLANPVLIKSTFLQVLNGVEEAHSKGVFLRDLKPENCLLDEDDRIHICDFGLATDEHISGEFRTGSVYHMGPECLGSDPYSPRQCDIWSLGILLINLITSRNPWREASMNDSTFASYFHSHPYSQTWLPNDPKPQPSRSTLQDILPMSTTISCILSQILHPVPSERLSLEEIKVIFEELGTDMDTWYDPTVVIDWEAGYARCAWEVEKTTSPETTLGTEPDHPDSVKSVWSRSTGSLSGSVRQTSTSLYQELSRAIPEDLPRSVPPSPSTLSSSSLSPPPLSPSYLSSSSDSNPASPPPLSIDVSAVQSYSPHKQMDLFPKSAISTIQLDSNGIPKTPSPPITPGYLGIATDGSISADTEGRGRIVNAQDLDTGYSLASDSERLPSPLIKFKWPGKRKKSIFGAKAFGRIMLFRGGE